MSPRSCRTFGTLVHQSAMLSVACDLRVCQTTNTEKTRTAKNRVDFEFDHSLSHFHAELKKSNIYPGVAQLGARVVWECYRRHPLEISKPSKKP